VPSFFLTNCLFGKFLAPLISSIILCAIIVRRVLGFGALENELELMSLGTLVGILRSKLLRAPRAREMPHKTRHPIRYRHNRRSVRHCRQL
jgi:hypothetical protein